jgi:hypothetical protein
MSNSSPLLYRLVWVFLCKDCTGFNAVFVEMVNVWSIYFGTQDRVCVGIFFRVYVRTNFLLYVKCVDWILYIKVFYN